MFLPLDDDGFPFDPTNKDVMILPWEDKTFDSWKNFWKIFCSWDVDTGENPYTKFYKRHMWQIFKNMVFNLRQGDGDRRLLSDWRHHCADPRPSILPSDPNERSTRNYNNSTENDCLAIEQAIQAYNGATAKKGKTKAIQDMNKYLEKQINTLENIQKHANQIKLKKQPFDTFSFSKCNKMLQKMKTDNDTDDDDYDDDDIHDNDDAYDDDDDIIIDDEEGPSDLQTIALNRLKYFKKKPHNLPDVKDDQLLGLLLGPPGAGKTYSIKALSEMESWKVLFTATTHAAAAQLDGVTINGVCVLGPNHDNFKYKTIPGTKITKIRNALKGVSLLVIDEVSMLTPVTLAKINVHLQAAFNKNYVFGGKDIVLVGDFWQFPPVSDKYQGKMSLYQAAVRTERGIHPINDYYGVGANLFKLFKLVKLKEQKRADKEYNIHLSKLRNYKKKYPITKEWFEEFNTLNQKDMENKDIDWTFTPTIVSGNYERRKIIEHKMMSFGSRCQQPILRWINKIATGRSDIDARRCHFEEPKYDPEETFPELITYFVRGAECTLTQEVHGFPKETRAKYIGVAWKDPDEQVRLDNLNPGQLYHVTVPDYVIVETIPKKPKKNKKPKKPKIIPLKALTTKFKDKISGEDRTFEEHPCELSISRTYHKVQGATYDSLILSLNSVSPKARKIHKLTITSLYVGASRVHNFDQLRILPLSEEEIKALTKLTIDPLLRTYFQNYDKEGNWITGKLLKENEERVRQKKLELGMIHFDSLTKKDCIEFATTMDLHIEPPKNIQQYKNRLRDIHSEARKKLKKNNCRLLKQKRINVTRQ